MAQERNKEVIQVGLLSTDTSPVNQPKGTTTFALNAVNETDSGNLGFISVEEGNAEAFVLPADTIPLGKVYVGNQEYAHFLCDSLGNSYIVTTDRTNTLKTYFSDVNQSDKMGFQVNHQIDATFRLRKGNERTLYWVDPVPRTFILDRPDKFKDPDTGLWVISKFRLNKRFDKIPEFQDVIVLNSGGVLPPGSYNFSIQYLDEGLNPTEYVTTSETVNIYNDDLENPYRQIRGSSAAGNEYFSPSNTNKAIRIELTNLDTNYPFYKIAIVEANMGTGIVNSTKLTSEISTSNPVFTYTGSNYETEIAVEELAVFSNDIESATNILQLENMLILSDVKGKPTNLCVLQKYASRIKADCVVKQVVLNQMSNGNPKRGVAAIEGLGHMPGEIESYGIVYIFADKSTSPVYHIPGRTPDLDPGLTYQASTPEKQYYPMRGNISTERINSCVDVKYTDNNPCQEADYWGVDCEGVPLKNTPLRHHRFPLRSEIGLPLYEVTDVSSVTTENYAIRVSATGTLANVPVDTTVNPTFTYTLDYTTNSELETVANDIGFDSWDQEDDKYFGPILDEMPVLADLSTVLKEIDIDGVEHPIALTYQGIIDGLPTYSNATASYYGLTYTITIEGYIDQEDSRIYVSNVLGIEFSGIEKPSTEDLKGVEVIGYYIVRQERTEVEKTILDNGILTPTLQNKNFVSHGLLCPDFPDWTATGLKKDFFALINPEFKFNNKLYTEFDEIILEGNYNQTEVKYSRFRIQDVMDGSSYNSSRHKKSEKDSDGWDLHVRTRDSYLEYQTAGQVLFNSNQIKKMYYLDALTSQNVEDSTNTKVDLFNVSCDNKIGILSTTSTWEGGNITQIPYVVIRRNNANPYSNYRTTPYFKAIPNPVYFDGASGGEVTVFNGDSYVTPMKYVSTMFYENRIRKRRTKSGLFSAILGGLLIIAGVAAAIFTGGASLVLAAAGIAIAGGGVLLASGIKQDNWSKTYGELYDKGLRETVQDDYITQWFKNVNPPDDEIRWFADALTNVWVESSVNMALRYGSNVGANPDFIDAPAQVETGNGDNGGVDAKTVLDLHLKVKLTIPNSERTKSGREYLAVALPELYQINKDFTRRSKQKYFDHLPFEYECCSSSFEEFPHRIVYTEQSFQEELTDNFRNILPNNYIDIEGETGPIRDMFRIQSNLYIHTEEALWHLPITNKERVVDGVVSLIGSGSYFDSAPRKIVDDENSSAGTLHKWGRLKTKHGVLFPSQKDKKWYLFNGQNLQPISDKGISSEMRKNMKMLMEDTYYLANSKKFPFSDNPSNPIGSGYISVYDAKKERLIVTKKDFQPTNLPTSDYELCATGNSTVIFENFSQIISDRLANGYYFEGIENCQLKFRKTTTELREEIRTITSILETNIPSEAKVYLFLDTSGSFNTGTYLADLEASVREWYLTLRPTDTTYSKLQVIQDGTERWLNFPSLIVADAIANAGGKAFVISLVNEASGGYHTATLAGAFDPTSQYIYDYNKFVNDIYPQFSFFKAVTYPIATVGANYDNSNAYIRHTLLALKGDSYTQAEADAISKNDSFSVAEWDTVKTVLTGTNPYATLGLGVQNYGWLGKVDRNDYAVIAGTQSAIITGTQFGTDLTDLLASGTTGTIVTEKVVETVFTTVEVPVIEFDYQAGVPYIPTYYNNGWTMSYSLKFGGWVSYHSYIPNYYFHDGDRFYSLYGGKFWKHNKLGVYRKFYGIPSPFVLEFVSNPSPLQTMITDEIMFQTEAVSYDSNTDEYYDRPAVTFNKILLYNSNQISGWLNLIPEVSLHTIQFPTTKTRNLASTAVISRKERSWYLNDFRDFRSNTSNVTMFNRTLQAKGGQYFIDKIVAANVVDIYKDWTQLESFRDKYLVVRLVFDNFVDTRLTMNFSALNDKPSER